MERTIDAIEAKQLLRLSRRSSIPLVDLQLLDISDGILTYVPAGLALELLVIPVHLKIELNGRRTLYVAVRHPQCEPTLSRLREFTGISVRPLLASQREIIDAIEEFYGVPVPTPSADEATAA
ncbi:MAG: hypothetical protein MUC50_16355 [Myxococcota bacterium]|jgi:hypothetical protein|nr:hypothetical protein [Myxococcota bacterium]